MGLRCLLGHDFDEPEIEREREEDGNEVVTTVREVKTCTRCGETQIVSENTEVTTVEQLADQAAAVDSEDTTQEPTGEAAADPTTETAIEAAEADASAPYEPAEGDADAIDDGPAADDGSTVGDGPTVDSGPTVDDGAEIIDADADASTDDAPGPSGAAEPVDSEHGGTGADGPPSAESLDGDRHDVAETGADGTADAETADAETADTDDGVILDDEPEVDPERDPGAWPSVDDAEKPSEEPTPWPEQEGEDEGFDAEVGSPGDSGVEFGGGLTPTSSGEPSEDDEGAEYIEPSEADGSSDTPGERIEASEEGAESAAVDTGFARGESPELRASAGGTETEYYCPACEMTRGSDGSSMRAGDICPECKRGYVDERPVEQSRQ